MQSEVNYAYFILGAGLYSNQPNNDVKTKIANMMCRLGTEFIQDDRIQFQSKDLLMDLLKRDDLQVENEASVLDAVMRWGRQQCKTAGIDETRHENIVPFVECLLPLIRLPTDMSPKFWVSPPFSYQGFAEHAQKLSMEFHVLKKYNNIARKGQELGMLVFKRTKEGPQTFTRLEEEFDKSTWAKGRRLPSTMTTAFVETIHVLLNGSYVIRGVTLVKGIFGEDFKTNDYNYEQVEIIGDTPDGSDDDNHQQMTMKRHEGVTKVEDGRLCFTFKKPKDVQPGKFTQLKVLVMGSVMEINKATRVSKVLQITRENMRLATGLKKSLANVIAIRLPILNIAMQLPSQCGIEISARNENQVPLDNGIIDEIIVSQFKKRDEV